MITPELTASQSQKMRDDIKKALEEVIANGIQYVSLLAEKDIEITELRKGLMLQGMVSNDKDRQLAEKDIEIERLKADNMAMNTRFNNRFAELQERINELQEAETGKDINYDLHEGKGSDNELL